MSNEHNHDLKPEPKTTNKPNLSDETLLTDAEKKCLHEANGSEPSSANHLKVRRLHTDAFQVEEGTHTILKARVVKSIDRGSQSRSDNAHLNEQIQLPAMKPEHDTQGRITHFEIPAKPQSK